MYSVDPQEKKYQYNIIFQQIHSLGIIPKYACTLPGLSGYSFEKELSEKYPTIKFDCFENSRERLYSMRYDIPNNIKLFYGSVDNWTPPPDYKYDVFWLDYCGAGKLKEYELAFYLNPNSIFALTECKDRKCKKLALKIGEEAELVERYEYGHMRFRCFRIGEDFKKKYNNIYNATFTSLDDYLHLRANYTNIVGG